MAFYISSNISSFSNTERSRGRDNRFWRVDPMALEPFKFQYYSKPSVWEYLNRCYTLTVTVTIITFFVRILICLFVRVYLVWLLYIKRVKRERESMFERALFIPFRSFLPSTQLWRPTCGLATGSGHSMAWLQPNKIVVKLGSWSSRDKVEKYNEFEKKSLHRHWSLKPMVPCIEISRIPMFIEEIRLPIPIIKRMSQWLLSCVISMRIEDRSRLKDTHWSRWSLLERKIERGLLHRCSTRWGGPKWRGCLGSRERSEKIGGFGLWACRWQDGVRRWFRIHERVSKL